MTRSAAAVVPWLLVVAPLVAAAPTAGADDDGELRFVRVTVPADALADLPLAGGRYVPMPLADFEDAVARLGAAGHRLRTGMADEARYELALDAAGQLRGTVEFTLTGAAAWLPGQMPLGRVAVDRCTVRTADGSGEAAVFCLPDGTAAVRTPGPAAYACEIVVPRSAADPLGRLPLVPALVTTVDLELPDSVRPVVGADNAAVLVERPAAGSSRWRIVRGPVASGGELPLLLQRDGRGAPLVRAWNGVTVRGREAKVVTRLEPAAGWTPGSLALSAAPTLRVTAVVSLPDEAEVPWAATEGGLTVEIPDALVGTSRGLLVTGIVPVASEELAPLPILEPVAARWGGCNTRLAVDPTLSVQRVRLSQCRATAPAAASRWPLPATEPPAPAAGIEPARWFLEHEAPRAEARVAFGPREASLDTGRVTSVDISPGTVLGRTTVDIRVTSGQVFGIAADVAPGWFIDSVEAVDWGGRDATEAITVAGRTPEWRVVRSPRGSELRIGLPAAASPRRGLGLRITGHRSGLPLGAEFSSDEMDMVRFAGEKAVLEFQLGPTAVLETAAGSLGLEPMPDRLAALAPPTAPRARIPAGERAPAARARLVRRRPPLEAEVGVDLVARDDRLAETFTFTCRPVAGELDAAVVHFSAAMGPGLEWSLASGAGGSLAAQLLDPGDATRGEVRSEGVVAESWLVELRPATTGAVTFRAARTVPLESAVSVPLAWVEAAERPGGTVTVRGEPGRRPAVVNHQLRELPPVAAGDPGVLELAYGPPRSLAAGPAAEVAAAPSSVAARAWAWRQSTTCWCHASGELEWEASFDIENQGRESATLTLPPGLRAEGVTVGGEPVAAAPIGRDSAGLTVPLPQAGGRMRLVVRGSGRCREEFGWWRIGGIACGIDMPVLDPEAAIMLPPGLLLVSPAVPSDTRDWGASLFGTTVDASASHGTIRQGFRRVPIADPVGGAPAPIVVRRQLVVSLAIVAGGLAALGSLLVARRSGPAAIALCGVAAIAAIWSGGPWDMVARAALWGGILGTWAAGWRMPAVRGGKLAAAVWLLAAAPVAAAEDREAVRVYVTPADEGGTALVPERLFRRLSDAAAAAGPPSVRVLAVDVSADVKTGLWRVRLELDADRGGALVLDQGATTAAWGRPAGVPPQLSVTLGQEGRTARIAASAAGRYDLDLELRPAVGRDGDLDVAAVSLPPAPRARLRLVEPDGDPAVAWRCDRANGQGPWLPVEAAAGSFSCAGASRVRLVRAADSRSTAVSTVRTAVSFNDIALQADGCRLTARFDVGSEREIVRSLVLRADPALEPVAGGDRDTPLRSLGDGRYAVEIPEPRAGPRRIVVGFRMPMPDPVGVLDAPSAWLVGVENDVRTVRLRPAADLDAAPELPAGMSLLRPREEDGAGTTAVWRSDAGGSAADGGRPGDAAVKIVVRRRPRSPSVTQDLDVQFAEDHVGMRLRCRIDVGEEPLLEIPLAVPPAAIIDELVLKRDPAADGGEGPWRRVDLFWSREAADRILAVVQRPERGRFRLQLDARLPIRPASRGQLPIARVAAEDVPLEVACRAAAGMAVRIDAAAPAGSGGGIVLSPGGQSPAYSLTRDLPPAAQDPVSEPAPAAADREAAATTSVDLAIDARGRAWGLARFDLIAREQVVRLVLPPGMRLFDVRADGREVTAVPGDAGTWDVRLHDVDWPRSLVAVVAGTLGGRLADGGAIRIEPPRLAGLPAARVLWSLDTPAGFVVRVSEPARVLDPGAFAARQASEHAAFDEALRDAVRQADPGHQRRLDAFASARREGGGPAGELAWYEAWRGSVVDEPKRTLIVSADDGSVTIRAARVGAASAPTRGLVTAAILGVVSVCWTAARRFPAALGRVAGLARRWWWPACGLAWLLAMDPPLPGLLMLLGGLWAAWLPASADDGGRDRSSLELAPD